MDEENKVICSLIAVHRVIEECSWLDLCREQCTRQWPDTEINEEVVSEGARVNGEGMGIRGIIIVLGERKLKVPIFSVNFKN